MEKGATFSIHDPMFINVRPMYFLKSSQIPEVHVSSSEKVTNETHFNLLVAR